MANTNPHTDDQIKIRTRFPLQASDTPTAYASPYATQKRSPSTAPELLRSPSPTLPQGPQWSGTAATSSSSKSNTRFLDQLRELPELRSIPWRPGSALPPERALESPRVQQSGAVLLSTRGHVAKQACTQCQAGYGRFSDCITLARWYQGACAGCIYTSKGNKCSIRRQLSGVADGRALRYHADNPEILETVIRKAAENYPRANKRKKLAKESLVDNVYADPANSTLPNSPDADTLLQAQIYREQNESYTSNPKQNGQRVERLTPINAIVYEKEDSLDPTSDSFIPINTIRKIPHPLPVAKNTYPTGHFQRSINTQQSSISTLDNFPKAKQRQICRIIGGVEVGIRNLQQELNSLRSVLGIEDPDLEAPY